MKTKNFSIRTNKRITYVGLSYANRNNTFYNSHLTQHVNILVPSIEYLINLCSLVKTSDQIQFNFPGFKGIPPSILKTGLQ